MKTISKISCALLGAMLLSSIFSGLVVGITEAVKLSLWSEGFSAYRRCTGQSSGAWRWPHSQRGLRWPGPASARSE